MKTHSVARVGFRAIHSRLSRSGRVRLWSLAVLAAAATAFAVAAGLHGKAPAVQHTDPDPCCVELVIMLGGPSVYGCVPSGTLPGAFDYDSDSDRDCEDFNQFLENTITAGCNTPPPGGGLSPKQTLALFNYFCSTPHFDPPLSCEDALQCLLDALDGNLDVDGSGTVDCDDLQAILTAIQGCCSGDVATQDLIQAFKDAGMSCSDLLACLDTQAKADLNGDGYVDCDDLAAFLAICPDVDLTPVVTDFPFFPPLSCYAKAQCLVDITGGDINGDSSVDCEDLTILASCGLTGPQIIIIAGDIGLSCTDAFSCLGEILPGYYLTPKQIETICEEPPDDITALLWWAWYNNTNTPEESKTDSDTKDCNKEQKSTEGPKPVKFATGAKIERAVDAVIRLPGGDFSIDREYTSQTGFNSPGLVGANWTLSCFRGLYVSGTGTGRTLTLVGPPVATRLTFVNDPGITSIWRPKGGASSIMASETTVTIGTSSVAVWRIRDPGKWSMDIYRGGTPFDGLVAQEGDAYGNIRSYEYTLFGPTGSEVPRLTKLYLNGTSDSTASVVLTFRWHRESGSPINGKLNHIRIFRRSGSTLVETGFVDYVYKSEVASASSALGANDDLVEVIQAERVDSPSGTAQWGDEPYRTKITQYRYQTTTTAGSSGDERLNVVGTSHQLKSVINPEQIEFYAQQRNADGSFANADNALFKAANELMTLADGTASSTWPGSGSAPAPVDLAAKIVSYYTASGADQYKVKYEYIQTACGCSGNTQGVRQQFDYLTAGTSLTVKVTETTPSSGAYTTAYRTTYYDLAPQVSGGPQFLVNKAIVEPGSSPRTWVWHYEYDSSQRLQYEMTPAAMSSYTVINTGTSTPASYTASTTQGLRYKYAYNTSHHRTTTELYHPDTSSPSWDLVEEVTYHSTNDYLPITIKRYTDAADTTTGTKIEQTDLEYWLHSGTNAIGAIRTRVEGERVAENGPSDTQVYDSYELFTSGGLNEWSRAADGVFTRRQYDSITGAVTQVTRNADSTYLATHYGEYALGSSDVSGWTWSTSPTLTTTYEHDLLGRTTKRTTPGGVNSYTIRELREDALRPHLLYFADVSLPHSLGSGAFDGPVSVSWLSAGGKSTRSSNYTLSTSATYNPTSLAYTLDAEVARSASIHTMSGLLSKSRVWDDATGRLFSGGSYYETSYTYDDVGRLETTTSHTGTVRYNASYDVLGRVKDERVGTSKSNALTVAEYFYDHTLSGTTPVQGMGNGNLTCILQHTGDSPLATDERRTVRTFDWRDRLVRSVNPEQPHEVLAYDNLDRVVVRTLFSMTSPPTDVDHSGSRSSRGLYVRTAYSQRGLPYKQAIAIDPTQSSLTFLESNVWYDADGRIVEKWDPDSPGTKTTFDELGRVVYSYVTDRGGDPAPGASNNYDSAKGANGLTSDHVIEQSKFEYNSHDHVSLVTHMVRTHDTTATEALDSGSGVRGVKTFVGYFYDGADRRVRTIAYGTNTTGFVEGGTAPTLPTTKPEWNTYSDNIVTGVEFDAIGRVDYALDGRGYKTKYFYDDLDRRIAVAENFEDAGVSWTTSDSGRWTVSGLDYTNLDTDRVTSYVYNASNNVILQTAHTPSTSSNTEQVQMTRYTYGVVAAASSTTTNSLIYHKDLLLEAVYPSRTDGKPGSGNSYKVRYAYNQLGELRSVIDQNGTTHEYTRDLAGRATVDTAVAFGTNISNYIKRIRAAFDGLGRLSVVRSDKQLVSSVIVANAVEFTYTPLWQVDRVFQNVSGDIVRSGNTPTAPTVAVAYGYSTTAAPTSGTSASDFSRVSQLTYPSGNTISYGYDSSESIDDRISRIQSIANPSTSQTIVSYKHVGLDMFALVDYPQPDVQLDRTMSAEGKRRIHSFSSQNAGVYPGWDRHGRIAIQAWMDGGLTTTSGGTWPSRPPILEDQYSYNQASNRNLTVDIRPGVSGLATRDRKYAYDKLDRLTDAKRGVNGTSFTQDKGSQNWALDMLGNWKATQRDADGDGYESSETENREHNTANEITNRYPNGTGNSPTLPFSFDDAGNLREEKFTSSTSHVFTHDAWNRLVGHIYSVSEGASPESSISYEYNGLHWRTLTIDSTGESSDEYGVDTGTKRSMYYSAAWQLLEERIDLNYLSDPGTDRKEQEVWGVRYIDDPVLRLSAAAGDDGNMNKSTPYYHITDAQFSTVAMIHGASGYLVERVVYDAYGKASHSWPGDFNADRAATSADSSLLATAAAGTPALGSSGYDIRMDLNRDGVINSSDQTIWSSWGSKAALADGELSDRSTSGPDSVFGYDGYVFAPELQRYCVRFRWLDPTTGRWMERDPLSYINGSNLFEYCIGDPIGLWDTFGLSPDDEEALRIRRVLERNPSLQKRDPEQYEYLKWKLDDLNQSTNNQDTNIGDCGCNMTLKDGYDQLTSNGFSPGMAKVAKEIDNEFRASYGPLGVLFVATGIRSHGPSGTNSVVEGLAEAFTNIVNTRTGGTRAGAALLSHIQGAGHRLPSSLFKLKPSKLTDRELAKAAIKWMKAILETPGACSKELVKDGKRISEVRTPSGHGFQYEIETGRFRGWLEPITDLIP